MSAPVAPVDPRYALFENIAPQGSADEQVAPQIELLKPEENVVAPEERRPLGAKVPMLSAPRKPKTVTPKVKPKPTQDELIQDNVTENYSTRLINYIKRAEGNSKAQAQMGNFKGGRFHVYDDVGAPAIGYGHRLLPGERFDKGITEEQAHQILLKDIKRAEILGEKHFGKKGWAAMDPHRREMAIDFIYNLGPESFGKFKTFSRALRQGDINGIRAKYKRHYSPQPGAPKVPLKARNDLFYKTFIEPLLTGEVEIGQQREPVRTANR